MPGFDVRDDMLRSRITAAVAAAAGVCAMGAVLPVQAQAAAGSVHLYKIYYDSPGTDHGSNASLNAENRPYLLIGVGRWGSNDPWLGIPVEWDEISGARAIVEAGFRDFRVTPSQGSHFFQNLTAFQIGYFTVNPDAGEGSVDWEWLSLQPGVEEDGCVRHLQFAEPFRVVMNSRTSQGMIFKPGANLMNIGPE